MVDGGADSLTEKGGGWDSIQPSPSYFGHLLLLLRTTDFTGKPHTVYALLAMRLFCSMWMMVDVSVV